MNITALSICRSPLTHMSGSEGNEQIVMREPVMTPAGIRYVPMLSGNALRHRAIRAPAARYLVEQWELSGKLTMDQLNFLFHGGRLTQKGGRIDLGLQERVYRVLPMMKLLGCSLPGHIVPGNVQVHRGTMICRENSLRIRRMIPEGYSLPKSPLRPAVAYIQPWTYYRYGASTSAPDIKPTDGDQFDSTNMIMAGQSVIPGAAFLHGFSAAHMHDVEIGCLLHSLRLWKQAGNTLGGQSSKGHGRLETLIDCGDIEQEKLIDLYTLHVDNMKDEGAALLDEIFGLAAQVEASEEEETADASA